MKLTNSAAPESHYYNATRYSAEDIAETRGAAKALVIVDTMITGLTETIAIVPKLIAGTAPHKVGDITSHRTPPRHVASLQSLGALGLLGQAATAASFLGASLIFVSAGYAIGFVADKLHPTAHVKAHKFEDIGVRISLGIGLCVHTAVELTRRLLMALISIFTKIIYTVTALPVAVIAKGATALGGASQQLDDAAQALKALYMAPRIEELHDGNAFSRFTVRI